MSVKGAVISNEAANSFFAFSHIIGIPKPHNRTGSEYTSLSFSVIVSFNTDGRNVLSIFLSRGNKNFSMPGIVRVK